MNILNRLYSWYGKRNVLISIAVIICLAIAGIFVNFFAFNNEVAPETVEKLTLVTISRVDALGSESAFRVTGTVRAVSEARLQTEASGRITSVSARLGDTVGQGKILASIENSRERASLLQAEGAYDAAVAGAASSEVGVEGAQSAYDSTVTMGINVYRNSLISIDTLLHNDIDDLFTMSNGVAIGFKIDGHGEAPVLNAERTAIEQVIEKWSQNNVSKGNVVDLLEAAEKDAKRISLFADRLNELILLQDQNEELSQEDIDALAIMISNARALLNQTLQQIQTARQNIDAQAKALEQAKISGASGVVSASSAQVKIALGSLKAAQASYEKTLVRTPISGVVNALYLKVGEYANPGAPAAIVANNNALEITTALSTDDADMIEIGEEVTIDGSVKGIVTAIAPAIDPISGKKEVKLSVSDDTELTNGSTVSVEFKRNADSNKSQDIIVPLSALKIAASGPVAFTVSPENTLVAHQVVLGQILGDMVVVIEGLTSNSEIVVDARGLKEGEKVEVTKQ